METNDKRQTISENRASQQIDQGVMYSSSPDDKLSENIWLYGLKHHTMEINGDVTMETNERQTNNKWKQS